MDNYSKEDPDSFYHSVMVAISTFAEEASDKFAKEFAQTMDDMNNYAAYILVLRSVYFDTLTLLKYVLEEKVGSSC